MVGVLVAHPFVLFLASEARCYAMVFFLGAVFLASLLRGEADEAPRWRPRLLRIAVATAGLYTQFYFGFLLLAGAVGLLVLRRFGPLRTYLLDMVVVALLFLPGFLWVPELFERHLEPYAGSGALALRRSNMYVVSLASGYLFPAFGAIRIPLVGALVLCGILGLVRPRWPQLRAPVLLLLGVSGTLAAAFVTLKMVSGEIVQPRHATVFLLPVVALGFSISALALGRRGVPALAGFVVLCSLAGSWRDFSSLAKEGDWMRVARYVESQERDGEPILVTSAEAHPLFAMYYRGANQCRGYPGPEYAEVWDPRAYVVSDAAEVKRFVDSAIGDAPAFWLVANIFHTPAAVGRFVDEYCSVIVEAKFEGCRVQRLQWR